MRSGQGFPQHSRLFLRYRLASHQGSRRGKPVGAVPPPTRVDHRSKHPRHPKASHLVTPSEAVPPPPTRVDHRSEHSRHPKASHLVTPSEAVPPPARVDHRSKCGSTFVSFQLAVVPHHSVLHADNLPSCRTPVYKFPRNIVDLVGGFLIGALTWGQARG